MLILYKDRYPENLREISVQLCSQASYLRSRIVAVIITIYSS